MRKTQTLKKVLGFSLDCHPDPFYGTELIKQKTVFGGSVYPLLERLEKRGYLTSEWEKVDPTVVGRPRRHEYKLTYKGLLLAKEMHSADPKFRETSKDSELPEISQT